jgi:hypothetical protein
VLRTSAKGSISSAPKEKARGGGLSDWPTPRAAVSGPDYATAARGAGGISLATAAAFSAWNTPRATDGSNGGPNQGGVLCPMTQAWPTGWATPQARDHKGSRTGAKMYADRAGRPLNEQAANLLDQW